MTDCFKYVQTAYKSNDPKISCLRPLGDDAGVKGVKCTIVCYFRVEYLILQTY